jgi:hypothetical protein
MSKKPVPMDVSASPELLRLVQEIDDSGVGRVLIRDGVELAVITPIRREREGASQRGKKPRRDPKRVLNIIGIGASREPSDIAKHKDDYIAESILPRQR